MIIAIVTGASSGMGREMVLQIGDRFSGVDEIWVAARRRECLETLSDQTRAKIRVFSVDVTKPEEREIIGAALRENRPDVKILVNAAGFGVIGNFADLDEETISGMVRLNCEALCAMTQMVLPYMSKNSRIIQFASAAAFLPQPGFAVYAASKAFVLSYSRALQAELKSRKIEVTAVCPGPVKTEFFERAESVGKVLFYKKLVMANPKKVVKKVLLDSMAGKSVSVYGIVMKVFYVFSKIAPHEWILKLLGERPA